MITINPVFKVMAVTANSAALAAGSPVSALAIGQVGFFSYSTGLSIDGTNPAQNKSFFIAVGVDPNNTGSLADIVKSAGNKIQLGGIKNFNNKPYVAPVNKQILVTLGKVNCNTEYGVKFEFRSELTYRNYGYSNPWKSFTTKSDLCADNCTDCGAGDGNSVVEGLAKEIALDPDQILTTSFISPTNGATITNLDAWRLGVNTTMTPASDLAGTPSTTGGSLDAGVRKAIVTGVNANGESLGSNEATATTTGTTGSIVWDWSDITGATSYHIYVTALDGAAGSEAGYFTSATSTFTQTVDTGTTAGTVPTLTSSPATNLNSNKVAKLLITVGALALYNYSQINLNYLNPREVNAYLSFVENFGTDTTQVDQQALVYEDGAGYDLQEQEYLQLGWEGSPYRTSELLGVATIKQPYYITTNGTYQVFSFSYETEATGGTSKNKSSMLTRIAIPSANTTAINSVNAILHRIIDGASGNDTTVNTAFPPGTAYNVDLGS